MAMAHATRTSSQGKLKFSALKSLSLNITLCEHYGDRLWAGTLASCFRERRRRGLTLRGLCIEGYGTGAYMVCRLSSFIMSIKWTEVHEEKTDDEDSGGYHDVNQYGGTRIFLLMLIQMDALTIPEFQCRSSQVRTFYLLNSPS